MQAGAQRAGGGQFDAAVVQAALLHEQETAVGLRLRVLVGLAHVEQRRAQSHAIALELHAGLALVGAGGGEDAVGVAGEPRRGAARGQALGEAGVQRQRRLQLEQQRRLRQKHRAARTPGQAAVAVPGAFVVAHLACAQQQLPGLADADAVASQQRGLRAVQAPALGAEHGVGRRQQWRIGVDVAAADHLVDRAVAVDGAMQVVDADLELVLQHAGAGAAADDRLQFVVAAAVGRAAVVVDVVVAFAAEMVGHRVAGAAGRAVAAPGEAGVVVDQCAAVRGGHLQMPGVAEAVFVARLRIQRLDADRLGPRLVGEQAMHRHPARHLRAAEQLVARHRALLAVLVFHVQLQGRLRVDVPVRGQRQEVAVAVGVIDIAAQGLVRGVDAQAELTLAAEPVAQVHRRTSAAVVVAVQHQAAHVLRALGLVVDHAGRGGDAGQHPG
ncbi:hypothetical protein NB717_003809 [Xanthomonas sacchari]|nr:hypothetical protein [Xanthomonas sacchari]